MAPEEVPARPEDYFIPRGSGSHHALSPGVEIVASAGRGLMVSVVTIAPGAVVPEHSHPHEQMGYLASGRLEFTVGGITRIVLPGDVWRIPGGVVHRVVGLDETSVAVDVFHPVRDDYR